MSHRTTLTNNQDEASGLSGAGFHDLMRTLNLTLATIRKAQGKRNPSEISPGTADWHAVVEDFANDLIRYGYMAQLPTKKVFKPL